MDYQDAPPLRRNTSFNSITSLLTTLYTAIKSWFISTFQGPETIQVGRRKYAIIKKLGEGGGYSL